MNDLELLKRYLQNEIDSGSHKIFIFDKDYNTIEFKIVNALSEIDFIEKENKKLQSNWNSLRELIEQYLENEKYSYMSDNPKDRCRYDIFMEIKDKINELEGKDKE